MSTPVLETAAPAQPSVEAPPPPAPLASRIADTFFAPTRVFEQFRDDERAPWLGPVLVSLAVFLVLTALRPLFISNQQVIEFMQQKAAEMGQPAAPAEQMERALTIQMVVGTVVYGAWLFLRPVIVGGILAAIYGLLMGGRAGFRGYLAVASHAFLVSTLGYLVIGALMYATGRLDISLDASLLLRPDAKGVLASVLRAVTPFSVWLTALLALGGAALNRRRGWAGAFAILMAMQLGMALVFGLIGQMIAAKAASGS